VDCKCCRINRFFSDYYLTIFVDKNEIRNTDLGEMLGKWIEPEVICEDGIAD
jgi:hypothetical protein